MAEREGVVRERGCKALADFDDQLTAIKCPHCGDENLYR